MRTPIRRERGAVLIMVALAMLVLLALVGLVVDGGLAYLVKARLNAAVDSAALAGARAIPEGTTKDEQITAARAAANDFFAANIPNNYLLSSPKLLSTDVSFDTGRVTIDVRAEAPMLVSFMRVLGFTSLTPVAYAQTIRKDLDMAFVVDTSGSLYNSRSAVKASAKSFLNKFNVTQDRVGLIHFAYGAEVDNAMNGTKRGFDRASMVSNIDSYVFDGSTASVEGMWQARNELNKVPQLNRSSLRVIVFFSDGEPTALGAQLPFKVATDCSKPGVFDTGFNGLYDLNSSTKVTLAGCDVERRGSISSTISRLPDFYNAHDNLREFPIVTSGSGVRTVTSDLSTSSAAQRNIDRAARNLPEAIAAKARDEGIYVFTLGMGASLKTKSGVDNEVGENVLKCMANVADGPSRCYDPDKPVGMYCYAATEADLTPCFSRLASAILRISK